MSISREFFSDPRITQAKKLVLEALKEHQSKIKSVKEADSDLKIKYEDLLKYFGEIRGANLYFPYLGSGFGKGSLVELADGSIKYDMITGIGPHVYGHSNPEIISTSIDGALSDIIMEGNLQQNVDTVELCKLLCETSKLPHCFLSSSGVIANENALKVAFQHRFPARRIIAFDKCFAGRSLVASQITDKPQYRDGLPSTIDIDYIPYWEGEGSTEETLKALRKILSRYPKQHAIIIFELVQGEGGFYTAPKSFFRAIAEEAKKHEILIFSDEIQTFGRTYNLFAFQCFGLEDLVDIVAIGKMSQACATLFKSNVKPRPLLLSQTFTASSVAIKASHLIIKKLIDEGYYGEKGKIAHIHSKFVEGFERIRKKNPHLISGPYGFGGMIAFTPLDGSPHKVQSLIQKLFQKGVICFSAGSEPLRIRFLAPLLTITDDDIEQVLKILEETLLCHS